MSGDRELIDVQVRVPKELESKIAEFGSQCGLTPDQMASAMFVLAYRNIPSVEEDEPK